MHIYAAKNSFYAEQGRIITNDFAELTRRVYEAEAEDSYFYKKGMADGKWDGMMLQPHIGKSNWRGSTESTIYLTSKYH